MSMTLIIVFFSQMKLRRLFARVYVKNPLRIETFASLKKYELANVKDCRIGDDELKVVVIARHKSAWSIGFGHVFMTSDEAEIWKECLDTFSPDDVVFPLARQLGSDVRRVSLLQFACTEPLRTSKYLIIRNVVVQIIYKFCRVELESVNDLRVSIEQQVGINLPWM